LWPLPLIFFHSSSMPRRESISVCSSIIMSGNSSFEFMFVHWSVASSQFRFFFFYRCDVMWWAGAQFELHRWISDVEPSSMCSYMCNQSLPDDDPFIFTTDYYPIRSVGFIHRCVYLSKSIKALLMISIFQHFLLICCNQIFIKGVEIT
jgi:hypothetical protein